MSCGGPAGAYPNPNNRGNSGRGYLVNNPPRGSRPSNSSSPSYPSGRTSFFNRHIYRASALIQQPTTITIREVFIILFAFFALYKGVVVLNRDVRDLLLVRRVADVCWRGNALGCAGVYAAQLWYFLLYNFLAGVVPWGFVAAVLAFFGEVVGDAVKGRK